MLSRGWRGFRWCSQNWRDFIGASAYSHSWRAEANTYILITGEDANAAQLGATKTDKWSASIMGSEVLSDL